MDWAGQLGTYLPLPIQLFLTYSIEEDCALRSIGNKHPWTPLILILLENPGNQSEYTVKHYIHGLA